ncbi:MAG: adenosylcobinamide-phosphate synthase CbiB, partial [Planctomycetota bacterium]
MPEPLATDALLSPPLLVTGAILVDLLIGDPRIGLHPIRLLGLWARLWEYALIGGGLRGRLGGIMHWLLVVGGACAAWELPRVLLGNRTDWGPAVWDVLIAGLLLCSRDLLGHARAVGRNLDELLMAREMVARMVGRDTLTMDRPAVVRASIESLAENLVDGVVTPLLALGLFGLPGLIVVKAISTLDSMVGYRNERYERFGWAAARSDDLIHWLPARLSVLIIALAARLGRLRARAAIGTALLWHRMLASPNSGWSEAAYAGALHVRLLGPIVKNGTLINEAFLGNPEWPSELGRAHLDQALRLTALCILLSSLLGPELFLDEKER